MISKVIIFIALALLHIGGAAAGGFLDQGCNSLFFVQDGILIAKCDDQACGRKVETRLDLNKCILNKNGNMYYGKGGGFFHSCKDCWIVGSHHLTCTCGNGHHDHYTGLIDLNNGVITNYYGYLNCFNTIQQDPAHDWPCKPDGWAPGNRIDGSVNGTHGAEESPVGEPHSATTDKA